MEVYPNPTSDVVNIKFSLLRPEYTKITITNSLGQELAVVMDKYCNNSEYIVDEIDVSTLPVGTYYVTLTSGQISITKVFTVVR